MAPWLQRLLTVAAGTGIASLSLLIPVAAPWLVPIGVGLAATAVPHTADRKLLREARSSSSSSAPPADPV